MSPKGKSAKNSSKSKGEGSPKPTSKKVDVAKRPPKEELVGKGILKGKFNNSVISDKVAPGIASATTELEKKKVEDVIRSHLVSRAPKQDLLQQNILLADPASTSGSIQQAQVELKKSQTIDILNKKLASRTSEDDLLEKNILKAPVTVAPGLVAKQQELQKSQIGDAINQQVKKHVSQGPPTLKKRDSEHFNEPHVAAAPAPSTKKTKSSHAL